MLKKKSLGQHFLHNAHYLRAVADAADIGKCDLVVEIGPGDGALTAVLLERDAQVIAIEKDSRLISLLNEKFKHKNFELHEADALAFDASTLKAQNWKLVGNIPYYITGALLKKFLTAKTQPSTLVFLIQKEVAERIAKSKKESILSLSVKAYGQPKLVKAVPRGAFSPVPKVDSAILAVTDISRKNFTDWRHEERFFDLVRAGFAQKRKQLKNNLAPLLGPDYASILKKNGIAEKARAEDLSLAQWLALSQN